MGDADEHLKHAAYEHRYVAFIDVLGFTELVNSSADSEFEFMRAKDCLVVLNAYRGVIDEVNRAMANFLDGGRRYAEESGRELPDWYPSSSIGIDHAMFSDSIVFSTPVAPTTVYRLISIVSDCCISLLRSGITVRGAIACGKLYHRQDAIFGPALIEAYALEKDVAKYPRILLTTEVEEAYRKEAIDDRQAHLREDFDGLQHVDVLWSYFKDRADPGPDSLSALRDIALWLFIGPGESQKMGVKAKWAWYKKYFDQFVSSQFPHYLQELSTAQEQMMKKAIGQALTTFGGQHDTLHEISLNPAGQLSELAAGDSEPKL